MGQFGSAIAYNFRMIKLGPHRLLACFQAAKVLVVSLVIAAGTIYPASILAQVTNATGTIQGTVTDTTGAIVPNVKITLTQPSTGSTKVLNATGSGYYSAGSLVPGDYTVAAEAAGFSKTTSNLTVRVGVVTNGTKKKNVLLMTTRKAASSLRKIRFLTWEPRSGTPRREQSGDSAGFRDRAQFFRGCGARRHRPSAE